MSKIFNDAWMSSYGFLRSRLDGSTELPTVGDVLRRKSGALPDLVHTHPAETVRDAIGILREYGVSQMPVVGAEPPVMAGEVAGSVSEREKKKKKKKKKKKNKKKEKLKKTPKKKKQKNKKKNEKKKKKN